MRKYRPLIVLLIIATWLPGCSFNDAVHGGLEGLDQARLRASIEVRNPPRFRLHTGTAVTLSSGSPVAPEWLLHAQAGVDKVFPITEGPGYQLIVNGAWDQAPGKAQSRVQGVLGFTGMIELPRPSATQTLTLQLRESNGQVLSQHQLAINPALWQADWDAPKVVEHAFYQFALLLTGS